MVIYNTCSRQKIFYIYGMKIIADSGSTKTSWRIINNDGKIISTETSGINPFFRSSDDIERELRENLLPYTKNVEEIHFYGAGIINSEKAAIVVRALKQMYGEIPVNAYSDVVGAARSLSGNQAGIVCIIGTGSNACYYDGTNVVDAIPPLGFILGDEGSGAVMGKNLVGDYFKKVMPLKLRNKLQDRFDIVKEDVLERVYKQEKPNQYLAGFAVFLSENLEEKYCKDFIYRNLKSFVIRNVIKLNESYRLPVHFVGTVAYVFQDLLKNILKEEGLTVGNIIKEPVDELVKYHQEKDS